MSDTKRSSGGDRPDPVTPRGKGRLVWSCCVYVATGTGFLCLIATWGVPGAITSSVLFALSAAAAGTSTWSGDDGRSAASRIARAALVAGLVGPAAIGLIAALGFAGVLIVLIFAGTNPTLTSRIQARWFAPGDRPTQQQRPASDRVPTPRSGPDVNRSAAEPMPELSRLDDAALCLVWRRSFLRLEAAQSAPERLAVVEQRQQYLDELQRRSPEGLAAWLAAGARASGNPLPYVGDEWRRAG
ncbi:hypothetical protein WBR16_31210 [Kribbella sp. CCNWLY201]